MLLLLLQLDSHDIHSEVLELHDQKRVALIMNIIGLMCDGQHKEMQNYLREQKNRIISINMVEEITSLLYEYSKMRKLTRDTLPLIIESFQTLIELCLGNLENIEVLFRMQILPIMNYYLQLDITDITSKSIEDNSCTCIKMKHKQAVLLRVQALKLKSAVVELLEAMLEKISFDNEKLTEQIAKGVSSQALHFTMVDFYKLKDDKDLREKKVDDNAYRALFKTYTVIRHLAASSPDAEAEFGEYTMGPLIKATQRETTSL